MKTEKVVPQLGLLYLHLLRLLLYLGQTKRNNYSLIPEDKLNYPAARSFQ